MNDPRPYRNYAILLTLLGVAGLAYWYRYRNSPTFSLTSSA
jgi:hypothetical protein